MSNDGATPIVERDETFLEAVEEFVSNVVNLTCYFVSVQLLLLAIWNSDDDGSSSYFPPCIFQQLHYNIFI